jgi:hypothetical protein
MAFFVLMVLGATFAGVYGLVSREFRSEAVVQLVPPNDLKTPEVPNWLARQVSDVGTDSQVLQDAWKQLLDTGYSRYDSQNDWLAALPREMEVNVDTASNKMTVRMLGNSPAGIWAAANAVAGAYVNKLAKSNGRSPQPGHLGTAMLVVAAKPESIVVTDHRLSLALSLTVAALVMGLLAVKLLRRAIMKNLRAIDDMVGKCEDVSDGAKAN